MSETAAVDKLLVDDSTLLGDEVSDTVDVDELLVTDELLVDKSTRLETVSELVVSEVDVVLALSTPFENDEVCPDFSVVGRVVLRNSLLLRGK